MKITNLTPDNHILSEFGQRLARIRKQQRLSQTALAEQAGIGVATLRRIENGTDSQLGSWVKLLKALDMDATLDALLPEEFNSPMAETLRERHAKYKVGSEANRKQSTLSSTSIVWGDEQA
ncbi:MAG: helix-turn-helix domain-containing protein [Porticoccaceae bacterium]